MESVPPNNRVAEAVSQRNEGQLLHSVIQGLCPVLPKYQCYVCGRYSLLQGKFYLKVVLAYVIWVSLALSEPSTTKRLGRRERRAAVSPVTARSPPQASFFHQHGCATSDTNAKYNSRAAQLYRDRIKALASQATRKHGTDVSAALRRSGLQAALCVEGAVACAADPNIAASCCSSVRTHEVA